jgi:hypothetical protein
MPSMPSVEAIDEDEQTIRAWYDELMEGIRLAGKREGEIEGKFQGRTEGWRRGRLATHAQVLAGRLGRPLTGAERATLADRLEVVRGAILIDLFLSRERDFLASWLAEMARG